MFADRVTRYENEKHRYILQPADIGLHNVILRVTEVLNNGQLRSQDIANFTLNVTETPLNQLPEATILYPIGTDRIFTTGEDINFNYLFEPVGQLPPPGPR